VGVSENTSKRFYDILFGSDVNDFDILESMWWYPSKKYGLPQNLVIVFPILVVVPQKAEPLRTLIY
jgi:hypothetical protein